SASYQRTDGNSLSAALSTDRQLAPSSNWYNSKDKLDTASLRLFSDGSDALSTDLAVCGKLVGSRPTPLNGNDFMAATIRTPTGGTILLGPDEFRHSNELDNDLLNVKAQANYLRGKHLFTAGVEFEQLRVRNLFIATTNGAAE